MIFVVVEFTFCGFIDILSGEAMSLIYSLVAREQVVLVDYSSFNGNFSQVAVDVCLPLCRCSPKPTCPKLSDSSLLPTTPSTLSSKTDSSSSQWLKPTYSPSYAVWDEDSSQLPQKNTGLIFQSLRCGQKGKRSGSLPQGLQTDPAGVDGQV